MGTPGDCTKAQERIIVNGVKFKNFRLAAGLTQEELGLRIGYGSGNTMISLIERGLTGMSAQKIHAAAREFGIPSTILTDDQEYTEYQATLIRAFFEKMISNPTFESHAAIAKLLGVEKKA